MSQTMTDETRRNLTNQLDDFLERLEKKVKVDEREKEFFDELDAFLSVIGRRLQGWGIPQFAVPIVGAKKLLQEQYNREQKEILGMQGIKRLLRELKTVAETITPRELPTVTRRGKRYFFDVRLNQLRNVDDPHDFIDLSETEAEQIRQGL